MSDKTRDKVAALDFWSSAVEPQPLDGGITNTNFIVHDLGRRFVVRVGDDIPLHGVMRFNELAAAHAAHAAGLSPEIVYQADGVFVMRFVEGHTLSEKDVRQQSNLERIIPLIRTCHTEIPQYLKGPMLVFWPFHVCRSYILTAREGNSRMLNSLAHFAEINEELEKTTGKVKIIFGHNDLLAANFIDDGRRLWLIDWDYAGFNTGLFDLAGLSSNNGLSPEQENWVLETYYQRPVTDTLRRRLAAMKCVSLLRETLWSIVSEIHSTLAFDYENYTRKYLTRLEQAYEAFQQMG
jgi:thiamine kinase-like enzyme